MKTQIASLAFLAISSVTVAQQIATDTGGFTNKAEAKNEMVSGVKMGKWLEYVEWKDGSTVATSDSIKAMFYRLAVYKDGKLNGRWREYTRDGKLEGTVFFIDGKQTGLGYGYYPSGKIAFENDFTKRTYKAWYEGGQLMTDMSPQTGTEYSVKKEYFQNGQVKSETTYKDGKVVGKIKKYSEDGKQVK